MRETYDMTCFVKNFGAMADGISDDTTAIQAAIDACAAAGGGTVHAEAGVYLIRSVYMKDNVTFVLENGAKCAALPSTEQGIFDFAFFIFRNCRSAALIGEGTLDGNDLIFWDKKKPEEINAHPFRYKAKPGVARPRILAIVDSEEIRISGITLAHAPGYAMHVIRSHGVRIDGISIRNNLTGPNTDGIHVSSCEDVRISDCSLTCGDDAIAIDSCWDAICKHVTVANCVMNTKINAIRLYTNIDVRSRENYRMDVSDVVITGCTVNACSVFNITAERGRISNVVFSNFVIDTDPERTGTSAFFMTYDGEIEDISVSNVISNHNGAITLVGEAGRTIRHVSFDNVRMRITPVYKKYGLGNLPENLCENYVVHHYTPYGVYIRDCEDVALRNFDLSFTEGEIKDPIPAVTIIRSEEIDLTSFRKK